MRIKPEGCLSCPLHGKSTGFVGDLWSENVKIAVVKFHPSKVEVSESANLAGNTFRFWDVDYFSHAGIDPKTIGVVNVIRCGVNSDPKFKRNRFRKDGKPPDIDKKLFLKCSNICRQYDNRHANEGGELVKGGIYQWQPNAFIITYDPIEVMKAAAYKIFIRRAFEVAKKYSDAGFRPAVLMGSEAAFLVSPTLFEHSEINRDTTFKAWVGHHFVGEWPFGSKDAERFVCGSK